MPRWTVWTISSTDRPRGAVETTRGAAGGGVAAGGKAGGKAGVGRQAGVASMLVAEASWCARGRKVDMEVDFHGSFEAAFTPRRFSVLGFRISKDAFGRAEDRPMVKALRKPPTTRATRGWGARTMPV